MGASVRQFKCGPLSVCLWRYGGWVRLFGYGLFVRQSAGYQPLFSERNGLRKAHYLLGMRIEVLR